MSKKLTGKVAIVTGASKGIGAEIARQLAAAGAAVVVNYSSSKDGADRVVNEIKSKEGNAVAVQANLSKKADIERLFSETAKAFGRLDILVNNAGVYEFASIEEINEEHFHKQYDLNVLGLLLAPASGEAFWLGRRQHHQHQLGCQQVSSAAHRGVQRYQGSRRRNHAFARTGVGRS
jgi:3-oxoacyl-[acyl-carrier protein] reductase